MADDRELPDWLLERLAAGELPAPEAARLRARLEAEGGLARLSALEASSREILAAHPPAAVAAEVQRRARRSEPAPARRLIFPSALALGVTGLAVLFATGVISRQRAGTQLDVEETTARGLQPHLQLYRKQGQAVERLKDGASARAGDLVQIAYLAAGRRFGVIASVDAGGGVTLHLPERAGPAARLQSGKAVALPGAFELDASPGFERFVFVTGDEPFGTAEVLPALRPGGPPLPPKLTAFALTLTKAR
jgi:anti-sigma factor RsiW